MTLPLALITTTSEISLNQNKGVTGWTINQSLESVNANRVPVPTPTQIPISKRAPSTYAFQVPLVPTFRRVAPSRAMQRGIPPGMVSRHLAAGMWLGYALDWDRGRIRVSQLGPTLRLLACYFAVASARARYMHPRTP